NTFTTFYYQDQPPVVGEPGEPALDVPGPHLRFEALENLRSSGPHWAEAPWPDPNVKRVTAPRDDYSRDFLATFGAKAVVKPTARDITRLYMPPEIYDHLPPPPATQPDRPPL